MYLIQILIYLKLNEFILMYDIYGIYLHTERYRNDNSYVYKHNYIYIIFIWYMLHIIIDIEIINGSLYIHLCIIYYSG